MPKPSRSIDRKKIFTGVIFICLGVLLMLAEKEGGLFAWRALWVALLGLGLFFYLWGRFFSRGEA